MRRKGAVAVCFNGISITLGPPPAPETAGREPSEEEEAPRRTAYDHPSLWPSGQRPTLRAK